MVSSEYWFGAEASFYNDVATQSVRSETSDGSTLSKTLGTPTTRRRWTISFWIKRTAFGNGVNATNSYNPLMGCDNKLIARFDINDKFQIYDYDGNFDVNLISTMVFRDSSAWYNLVIVADIDGQSGNDRMKLYVNGVRQDWSGTDPQDYDPRWNGALAHQLLGDGQTTAKFNGYASDITFLDGQAVGETSGYLNEFGEVKNGVWIPKQYSGSYGNNGFRLEFKGTGTATSSGAVSSPTNIGDDSSGNNNHFAVTGFATTDSNLSDSPENNFAILNPLQAVVNDNSTKPTLSEGNLVMSTTTTDYQGFSSTIPIPTEGKYAFKVKMNTESSSQTHRFGVGTSVSGNGISTGTSGGASSWHNALVFAATVPRFDTCKNGTYSAGSTLSPATEAGDEIEFLVDMDNGTIDTKLNGSAYGTQITGMPTDKPLFPFGTVYESLSSTSTLTFTFDYTPSDSNYLTICSANLPEPTISPNATTQADDHFNTVVYTGNGGSQSITGVGFQPDWTWIKSKSSSFDHVLTDSSRGVEKELKSNKTDDEGQDSGKGLTSFDSDGFSLVLGTSTSYNNNSVTYVAWNWKANGTTPSKTYKVVVVSDSGNKYRFRNSADDATFAQSAVTLDLQEGGTYTFDWSDSTAQGHPIRFSTTSDGTHGGGSEYTTGVVKDDSAYKTTITVASSAPTLYYYCANHSGMGGQVNTNTTFGSTNFDGSILSVVQTNQTAGFSILTWTGNGSSQATIGHGLGTTPAVVITKSRSVDGSAWRVWHKELATAGTYLTLHRDLATGSSTSVWGTSPAQNDKTFSIGSNTDVNGSSSTYISYCLAEVEGYSKFGTYEGNNISTDGVFVFTGFRPAWIMIKNIDTSGENWHMFDSVRASSNVVKARLIADDNTLENTNDEIIDFLSNGFKLRDNNAGYNSAVSFVYFSFAETPFKFANAR